MVHAAEHTVVLLNGHDPPLFALLSATVQDYEAARTESGVPVQNLASLDPRQELEERW